MPGIEEFVERVEDLFRALIFGAQNDGLVVSSGELATACPVGAEVLSLDPRTLRGVSPKSASVSTCPTKAASICAAGPKIFATRRPNW